MLNNKSIQSIPTRKILLLLLFDLEKSIIARNSVVFLFLHFFLILIILQNYILMIIKVKICFINL